MTNDPRQQNKEMQSAKDEQIDNAYTQVEQLKKQARLSEAHFERVCKENAELKAQIEQAGKVYQHITNNQLSKLGYPTEVVTAMADDCVQEVVDSEVAELKAQLATAVEALEEMGALLEHAKFPDEMTFHQQNYALSKGVEVLTNLTSATQAHNEAMREEGRKGLIDFLKANFEVLITDKNPDLMSGVIGLDDAVKMFFKLTKEEQHDV